MKIEMKKIMAGPDGVYQPGDVLHVDDDTAVALVQAGVAVAIEETAVEKRETATVEADEKRTDDSDADKRTKRGARKSNRGKTTSKG